MFDVGQRVSTPRGDAFVLRVHLPSDTVVTDQGTFPSSQVSPWLDRAAITESIETLEAWLDDFSEPVSDRSVVGESLLCACPCGQRGNCHRLVHLDNEVVVKQFPHSAITGECRCVLKDCTCTH